MSDVLSDSQIARQAVLALGSAYLSKHWDDLRERTRIMLHESGCFTSNGDPVPDQDRPAESRAWHVRDLEHAVGQLWSCATASIPLQDVNTRVPRAALDDPHDAYRRILLERNWRDPLLLRLALACVVVNQLALARHNVGPWKRPGGGEPLTRRAVVDYLVVALLPLATTVFVVAAIKGEFWGAVVAAYVVSLGVHSALVLDRNGKIVNTRERDYYSWRSVYGNPTSIGDEKAWGEGLFEVDILGPGAKQSFGQMAATGVNVPAVAFDICSALEHSALHDT